MPAASSAAASTPSAGGVLAHAASLPHLASDAAPKLIGSAMQGHTLTASTGKWTNRPRSFQFRWKLCTERSGRCLTIHGAHGRTYKLKSVDVGHVVVAAVTAVNLAGSASATTPPSPMVHRSTLARPTNTEAPKITGSAVESDTLSVSNGTWTGNPTSYAYAWEDCGQSLTLCSTIPGATGPRYTLQNADAGHTIRAIVTASNSSGSTATASARTATVVTVPTTIPSPVSTTAPTNTAAPVITGSTQQGDTLAVSNGTWTGTPTSYSYQWQDCVGSTCNSITGATSSSYTLQASDVGDTIKAVVTATNSDGSVNVTSGATSAVTTAVSTAGLDGIYVSGSELVNGSGQQIHLHGVDEEGTEYACAQYGQIFDTPGTAQDAALMASWHINFVRIGLNALCVDCALGVPTAECGTNYMSAITSWVNELNADGIYVEVMLMWDFPGTSNAVGLSSGDSYQLAGGPTEDHAPQAWTTMAQDFKNNPNVMLGVWGEDYVSWSCMLNGGPTCGTVQASVETTTLTATASQGTVTSIHVNGLANNLDAGEPIWLGADTSGPGAADTLTVASNVTASSGTVTIPVTGTLSTSYATGATLYYGNIDPGDHTGDTPWLTGSNPAIDWDYASAGAQQAVNNMRAAGFNGPIAYTCMSAANVCANPANGGSYGGGSWLQDHPTDPDNSIVAAADLYGPSTTSGAQTCSGTACFNEAIKPIIQAGYPFIINEAGESYDSSDCSDSYISTMLPWMDANGASGYASWVWNGDYPSSDCLGLINSPTTATPNTNGSYASWLHNYYTSTFPANQ
jgi:Cellulase (glycosyl hydrolase family 5)